MTTCNQIIGEICAVRLLCRLSGDGHNLTHEVGDHFTHGGSEDEVLQQVWDEREGHAEDSQHQVTYCQRQQEGVSDRAHALIDRQDHNDQKVAKDAEQEDERVKQDPHRVHL